MHTEHDNKINGGGDCTVNRKELEQQVKAALMELPPEVRYELIREYAEKYGIQVHRIVKQ